LNAELSLIDNKFQQYKAIIQLYRALVVAGNNEIAGLLLIPVSSKPLLFCTGSGFVIITIVLF
jgi:hypothetical protein